MSLSKNQVDSLVKRLDDGGEHDDVYYRQYLVGQENGDND